MGPDAGTESCVAVNVRSPWGISAFEYYFTSGRAGSPSEYPEMSLLGHDGVHTSRADTGTVVFHPSLDGGLAGQVQPIIRRDRNVIVAAVKIKGLSIYTIRQSGAGDGSIHQLLRGSIPQSIAGIFIEIPESHRIPDLPFGIRYAHFIYESPEIVRRTPPCPNVSNFRACR